MCQLNGRSDWQCASESARCVGGVENYVSFIFLCIPFRHFLFSCFHVLQSWHETSCYVYSGRINLCSCFYLKYLSFVLIESKESCMHKPLIYNSQHELHRLIASHASAERTRCCAAGSTLERRVSMQLFCQTGQTRGNRAVG